ncbi:MAG TPA: hypothetical protein PLO89_11110, partial [Spirochaetota bacterium]|nr:hypothetical protein [Spirochaetota bacterium]
MQKLILTALILMGMFFVGCIPGNISKKTDVNDATDVKTVTIRSSGNSTVYKVNSSNLVTSSSYTNQYGSLNTKSYVYDENKELRSIERNNSVTG